MSTAGTLESRQVLGTLVTRVPSLLRGRLVVPPWPTVGQVTALLREMGPRVVRRVDETYLMATPVLDRSDLRPTGETSVLVLPAPDPCTLPEPDPAAALAALLELDSGDVASFVGGVRTALGDGSVESVSGLLSLTSTVGDRAHEAFGAQLRSLFDPATVREAMAVAFPEGTGWAPVPSRAVPGATARMAGIATGEGRIPSLRPVPTTQLHVTAGNTPVVPLASLLWGWCARGACVLKASADTCVVTGTVAAAIAAAPDHPLARHTTLTYWPGGDRSVEDIVLAPGAFERRLVWGSARTVADLGLRGAGTETVVMGPRYSLSLVGTEALETDPDRTVAAAAADSLVANQAACMSSVCHVVVGSPAVADAYAERLRAELDRWEVRLPHRPNWATRGRLVALRRGALAAGRWLVGPSWPDEGAAVVRHDGYADLAHHPGGRVVLVLAVPDLREFLRLLGPAVSTVGVAPDNMRERVRDAAVVRGVDNVLPLGCADEGYPGRPHDGREVIGRLARWVNG